MSMIGYLLRVDFNELEDYLQDSSLLEDRLDAEGDDGNLLDIDKTWEGILYILTGHGLPTAEDAKPPLKWVIFGDYILDEDQDLGYGPAEYRSPEQVQKIAQALQEIPDESFKQMFDQANIKMRQDTEPGILWPEGDEAYDYHLFYFRLIREFYLAAANSNQAVISFIG